MFIATVMPTAASWIFVDSTREDFDLGLTKVLLGFDKKLEALLAFMAYYIPHKDHYELALNGFSFEVFGSDTDSLSITH